MHIAGWAKIYLIFPPYRFTHPKTEHSIFVHRWSYLWAGLFGAIYVAYKGMSQRFVLALAVNIGFLVLAARDEGRTWGQIGDALQISRQAARQAQQRRDRDELQRQEDRRWRMVPKTKPRRLQWFRDRRKAG